MSMKKLLLILLLSMAIKAGAQPARRITVAQDGSGNFTTVQQALNAVPVNNKAPIVTKAGFGKEFCRDGWRITF
jgi:pectinesterase